MAPSIGQGANMAIEDAATLANALWRVGLACTKHDTSTTQKKLDEALRHYSTSLRARTRDMCARSEFLVRLQTHDGLIRSTLARYVIPFLGDVPASLSAKAIRAGPFLEFVDVPARACQRASNLTCSSAWIPGKVPFLSAYLALTAVVLVLMWLAENMI